MSHSAGVSIQSMRIHGNAEHKQAFLNSLDHQHWQGDDAEEIIFIKKIHVAGYWWELAQKIATRANESAQLNISSKQSDDVVVFKSRAALVAQIILELLKGETSWYGQLWLQQESMSSSPIALLTSRIVDLPEIFEYLIQHNVLADVMVTLPANEVQKLIIELKSFLKIDTATTPIKNDFRSANEFLFKSAKVELWFSTYLLAIEKQQVPINLAEPIIELICLLGLWRWVPHKLQSAEFRSLWQYQWINHFKKLSFVQKAIQKNPQYLSFIERTPEANQLSPNEYKTNFSQSTEVVQDSKLNVEANNHLPIDTMAWLTDFGGVFFLINSLRHLKSHQNIIAQSNHSPWIFIYHFAKSLCKMMSVDMDASLRDIFCELAQLDFDQLEAFSNDSEIQELVAGATESLEKKLRPLDLWSSDLLIARAKVSVEAAYINIYFDQSWVRLAIRRAGLDVNPGWVPWLGRVIRFHYGNFPELAQTVRQL